MRFTKNDKIKIASIIVSAVIGIGGWFFLDNREILINSKSNVYNVSSQNQSGGITAGKVEITTIKPRSINMVRDKLVIELLKYPPKKFSIHEGSPDGEISNLGNEITEILTSARWTLVDHQVALTGANYPLGVTIEVGEPDIVSSLIYKIFLAAGLKVTGNKTHNHPKDEIYFYIGSNY